jgi:hypothetical protein
MQQWRVDMSSPGILRMRAAMPVERVLEGRAATV